MLSEQIFVSVSFEVHDHGNHIIVSPAQAASAVLNSQSLIAHENFTIFALPSMCGSLCLCISLCDF